MQKKKKLKLKKSVIFKSLAIIISIMSIYIFIMFLKLNVLPFLYLLLLFLFLLAIDIGLYLLLSKKKPIFRIIGTICTIFFFVLYFVGIEFQTVTLDFLHQFAFLNIQTEHYQVIVKNTSKMSSLNDLENQSIAYVKDREGASKAYKQIEKEKMRKEEVDGIGDLVRYFLNDEIDVILLESSEEELYNEMSRDFKENHKVLDTVSVEVQKEDFSKDVSITKEPFSVYITGVDTYDAISSVARSDVNMVVTVNPVTHKILLTSIPRDYYVPIAGSTSELNDKLTHAGLEGVDVSIKTIENLLDMEINYYIKFNFTSLIQIVDALGGIDVDSPFAFTADYEEDTHIYYEFQKGMNHLNGKQALAYVRERYGLREGDVARAKHQQQVVEAVVNKLTTTTILTKYGELLGSMEGNFTTNFDFDSITGFVKMQLNDMPSWSVETQVLTGADASRKTASMPDLYSSVMIPDEEQLENAKGKIDEITLT